MSARVLHHTCDGVDHTTALDLTARRKRLGCGCTLSVGTRCDGTPIEVTDGTCQMHAADAGEGSGRGGAG